MVLQDTSLDGLKLFKKGKVRDVYDLNEKLLIIASDRISAFDVVLPTPIPYKGEILNQLSLFWFDFLKDVVENHIITADIAEYPGILKKHRELIEYRSVLVKKAKPFPVECIVRGYISGSGWKEYLKSGTVCGIMLPPNLKESNKLNEPVFTPSTKADLGSHDVNITFQKVIDILGKETAQKLKDISITLYKKAADYALTKGIIIADTKFEFGVLEGGIMLIDEVLTPDSSRFWLVEKYEIGKSQISLDKQYIRNYLLSIDWTNKKHIPSLPADVVRNTFAKYKQAYEQLTGRKFRINDLTI